MLTCWSDDRVHSWLSTYEKQMSFDSLRFVQERSFSGEKVSSRSIDELRLYLRLIFSEWSVGWSVIGHSVLLLVSIDRKSKWQCVRKAAKLMTEEEELSRYLHQRDSEVDVESERQRERETRQKEIKRRKREKSERRSILVACKQHGILFPLIGLYRSIFGGEYVKQCVREKPDCEFEITR